MSPPAAHPHWEIDHATQGLGIEVLELGAGTATLAMVVGDAMINGHGLAHGGFIFALADSAFAYACNSYGPMTVGAHASITFIRPGRRGDRLVARAREVSRTGRSGLYDVTISVDETVIAEFRGHSRIVGSAAPDAATPAQ